MQVAANEKSAIVQAKLKEIMEKGSMNSFDHIARQLHGESDMEDNDNDNDNDNAGAAPDIDAMDTSSNAGGKDDDKIPVKKNKKKIFELKTKGTGPTIRKQVMKLKRKGKTVVARKTKTTVKRKKGKVSF